MDVGYLGSGSECEDDQMDQEYEELRVDIDKESEGKEKDDGYLGSGSECEDDLMDHKYEESRVDIAEESATEGTTLGDGNSEGEDDKWKEFDEEAEVGLFDNLSESDRLSKLDDMLESDDLAEDAYEAEGWQDCLYFFKIQMTWAIRFFFRKNFFNWRGPWQYPCIQGVHVLKHALHCLQPDVLCIQTQAQN